MDAYSSFRNMLVDFVEMLKTGTSPINWRDTVEMTKVLLAARLSLQQSNRKVSLEEIA